MAGAEDPHARGHHAAAAAVAAQRQPTPRTLPLNEGIVSCGAGTRPRPRPRLHSFSLPSLGWGAHRLLRCAKVDPQAGSPSDDRPSSAERDSVERRGVTASASPRRREGAGCGGDGEGEGEHERLRMFRDEIMAELQKAVEKIPQPRASGYRREESKGVSESSPSPAVEEASRPWNLRLRRAAACIAASAEEESRAQKATNQEVEDKVLVGSATTKNTGRVRRCEAVPEKEKRPRFFPQLSKDEIVEDFFLMTGTKPPRRPKKRPRNVQKQIEALCPGSYLTEITPDLYKTSQGQ